MADAATEAAMGLIEEAMEDAPDAPQQPDAEGAEQTPEQEVDEFDMELPADLAAEIEAPVYDEETEEPQELEDEYAEPDEYEDPAVSEVKAQNRKLSKQLAWEKEQRLKQARKQWIDKDSRYFPLADTKAIAERTSSRREFAREAKAENDRIKALPGVQKLLAAKGGAQAAGEAQAEAWGTPTTGSGLVPSESAEIQAQIDKARQTKGFRGAVTEMLKTGKVSI